MAKGFVEVVDMVICQVKCHLLDTHITQEVFCNLFRRHFSSRHPLFEMFESHCEGTTPVGALGITSLIDEYRYLHRLFHIGHTGTRKLINLFYEKQHYDDSDFNMLLEVRAVFIQFLHSCTSSLWCKRNCSLGLQIELHLGMLYWAFECLCSLE